MLPFTMTNDTVTVYLKGEPHTVTKGTPNYLALRAAVIAEDWDAVPNLLTVEKAVETWLQGSDPQRIPVGIPELDAVFAEGLPATRNVQNAPIAGAAVETDFTVTGGTVRYKGEALPVELNDRIIKMAAKNESPQGLQNFWRRLKRNPNAHSVQQLFGFLTHAGIPIQPDGTFLAYKGVRRDFRDCHSGQFDNSPGKTIKMDRSKVSSDPATACHVGLHVGALSYARTFGPNTIIVRVDPEHVVCVPNDHDMMKMRTCEYTVIGLYGGQMPDTSFQVDVPIQYEAASHLDDDEEDDEEDDDDLTYDGEDDGEDEDDDEDDDEGYEVMEANPTLPLKGTQWDDFNPMTPEELLKQSIEDLRKYALYNCQITGASKIPGGKEALVTRILEVIRPGTPKVTPPTPVVEETKPAPLGSEGMKLPLTGTQWDHFNQMNSLELLNQSLDDLRKYACYNCLIVGASKQTGGKIPLIARIAEVRGDKGIE